eukprot:2345685-Rhodomonas_salina.1
MACWKFPADRGTRVPGTAKVQKDTVICVATPLRRKGNLALLKFYAVWKFQEIAAVPGYPGTRVPGKQLVLGEGTYPGNASNFCWQGDHIPSYLVKPKTKTMP